MPQPRHKLTYEERERVWDTLTPEQLHGIQQHHINLDEYGDFRDTTYDAIVHWNDYSGKWQWEIYPVASGETVDSGTYKVYYHPETDERLRLVEGDVYRNAVGQQFRMDQHGHPHLSLWNLGGGLYRDSQRQVFKLDARGRPYRESLEDRKDGQGRPYQVRVEFRVDEHGKPYRACLEDKKDNHGRPYEVREEFRVDEHGRPYQVRVEFRVDEHGRPYQVRVEFRVDEHGGPYQVRVDEHGRSYRVYPAQNSTYQGSLGSRQRSDGSDRHRHAFVTRRFGNACSPTQRTFVADVFA